MKLSVILPCFNGASTISVQLAALTRQHWPDGWELIVVNNGSTDQSMEIAQAYRDGLPHLQIVEAHVPNTPRLGVPHSYNTGIKAATGHAFVFCEADDEVGAGWLTAMGEALTDHPFVVARLDYAKLNKESIRPPYENGYGYQSEKIRRLRWSPYYLSASACGFGLQRSLYEQLGPLSTEFPIVHDSEYCCRAQLAHHTPHFEPAALVHYRLKPTLSGRFRQAQNWGRDSTRLEHHYSGLKRYALLRQLFWIARTPLGLPLPTLMFATRSVRARQLLNEWVWQLGWATGKLQAIVQVSRLPAKRRPAVGACQDGLRY